jgi:hypothetical protein
MVVETTEEKRKVIQKFFEGCPEDSSLGVDVEPLMAVDGEIIGLNIESLQGEVISIDIRNNAWDVAL